MEAKDPRLETSLDCSMSLRQPELPSESLPGSSTVAMPCQGVWVSGLALDGTG